MTTTTTPRCDYRSDLGLGCARAAHAEGAHWLTASADLAHADLRRIGFFRSADAEAADAASPAELAAAR